MIEEPPRQKKWCPDKFANDGKENDRQALSRIAKRSVDCRHKLENLTLHHTRIMNLLGEIVDMATNDPQRLVAFNSPLLQMASLETYEHYQRTMAKDGETFDPDSMTRARLQSLITEQRRAHTGKKLDIEA